MTAPYRKKLIEVALPLENINREAELIQKLGPIAETPRDLSYRLYTICERRKWAQEAIAYNALVLSWADVQRLAEQRKASPPMQGEMNL